MQSLDYSDCLVYLKLHSLQRRREHYCIIYVWKIIEGFIISQVLIDLHWLKIKERIFKAFIDHTAPLYLCELVEQEKTTTNTRLVGDAFRLKLPHPSRNCADTF